MAHMGSAPPPPFPRIAYPELHAALGALATIYIWDFLPASWKWPALAVFELVILLKETLFDPWREGPTQPFLWEGAKDFAWYHAGYAITLALLLIAHRPI